MNMKKKNRYSGSRSCNAADLRRRNPGLLY